MNIAVKLTLLMSGIFLLVGLLVGVAKYIAIMKSSSHRAPYYIDIAHRAALMYSFAALVMAELLRYSPYSVGVQCVITGGPLLFFASAIAQYIVLGMQNRTNNQFKQLNFKTTIGMWLLIVGEVGGIGLILLGFVQTQFL